MKCIPNNSFNTKVIAKNFKIFHSVRIKLFRSLIGFLEINFNELWIGYAQETGLRYYEINLGLCRISANDVKVIQDIPWPSLLILEPCKYHLISANNKIGPKGAKLLSKCEIPLLESLDLSSCFIQN